mgnify:CR=1 FL=1
MFDIGANLTSSHFSDDLDVVLNDSLAAGVEKICITSSNLEDVKNAKKITERYENIFYSVGFHPHNAKDFKIEYLNDMSTHLNDPKAICLGEMGLDFNRNFSSKEEQILCFESQLDLKLQVDPYLNLFRTYSKRLGQALKLPMIYLHSCLVQNWLEDQNIIDGGTCSVRNKLLTCNLHSSRFFIFTFFNFTECSSNIEFTTCSFSSGAKVQVE